MLRQKYPIGLQDFAGIREDGYIYIDKTADIYDLVNTGKYIFLSRPRRFGKSLLLSTLRYYFEGRKDLFKGLKIMDLEKDWKKYPVIHIKLSTIEPDSHESLVATLNEQFQRIENEYGVEEIQSSLGARFSRIITTAFQKRGMRVVILIDEYDNPLINTLAKSDIHKKNHDLLKSIYANLKDQDEYIRFGMLTGVSRFSKMTVFSGINNLLDITFHNRFSAICGITEKEIHERLTPGVENFARENSQSPGEAFEILKKYYDGYHFSEQSPDIYNPFSLFHALEEGRIGSYWLLTATPEFLVKKLKESNEDLSIVFQDTTDMASLAMEDTTFSSPVALLYQTGYLTIKGYDKERRLYKLGLPNLEVESGFISTLLGAYIGKDKIKSGTEAAYLKQLLIEGKTEEFIEGLIIFFSGIPYTVIPVMSEKYFQNALYLTFRVMGMDIEAEKATSFGRSDIIIKTGKYIYIFELKLDGSAQMALQQIERKGYALPYGGDRRKTIKIGIDFSSATRNIREWAIAE